MTRAVLALLPVSLLAACARPQAPPARGHVEATRVHDATYGRERPVWVYTPPGYSPSHSPYPVAYVLDGQDYAGELGLPEALDRGIAAGELPPLVAVMIDDSDDRLGDLANHEAFARFVGDELVPWARSRWHVSQDAARTLVVGYSAGGLAAAYLAWKRPELFGNVLSQSGAFWRGNEGSAEPGEWLTSAIDAAPVPAAPTRFYLEVGAEETQRALGSGPVFRDCVRRLRDVLQRKGYPLVYVEVPGAHHEPTHWRAQLPEGLRALAREWRAPQPGGGAGR